jgi:hypothetical protein
VIEAVEESGGRVRSMEFQDEGDRRRIDVRVRMDEGREAAALVDALAGREEVLGARWKP